MTLRIDRLLTTGLVQPFLQVTRRLRGPGLEDAIPILMYHSITDDPEPGIGGYYRLNTPPSLFRDHLSVLRDEGFTVVDLASAVNNLKSGPKSSSAEDAYPDLSDRVSGRLDSVDRTFRSDSESQVDGATGLCASPTREKRKGGGSHPSSSRKPTKLVVITFDDGFRDFLTAAVQALVEFGFTATVFLPTAFIGRERRAFQARECLTWDEIRELRRQGIRFGSHTVNHPKLWDLNPAVFASELRESRQTIEDELGEAVHSFAHPYAFPSTDTAYIDRFRATLTDSGYSLGVTTALGCARRGDDPLLLRRLPANGADDPALFRAKVHGAYDWLARPQAFVKMAKRMAFK